jgi:hypothetical protein
MSSPPRVPAVSKSIAGILNRQAREVSRENEGRSDKPDAPVSYERSTTPFDVGRSVFGRAFECVAHGRPSTKAASGQIADTATYRGLLSRWLRSCHSSETNAPQPKRHPMCCGPTAKKRPRGWAGPQSVKNDRNAPQ